MHRNRLDGSNGSSDLGVGSAFLLTVQARVLASADGIERTAARGDPAYQRMPQAGVASSLRAAAAQLAQDTASLAGKSR